jgi:ribonuclease R
MGKKNKKHSTSSSTLVKGTLEITRSGMGYVLADDAEGDILVRPHEFNKAFNGDKVSVRISRPGFRDKKREGAVVDVISRKQTDFIGTIHGHPKRWVFMPDSDKPMPQFDVEPFSHPDVLDGSKVIVKMLSWGAGERRPKAEFIDTVSAEDLGDMAMKGLLLEKGFPLVFSDEAMEDAARLNDHISDKELKKRKDFRNTLTFTIDPVDAKDFDDAISFKVIKEGLYEIGIHIADVSHFVHEGSILDEEAYARATSVYLPDRVNPMLPERISNELCSLRPHEDKFTFSAVFQINSKAEVKKHWLGRTVIHSDHRFTYEEAQTVIETGEGEFKQEIGILNGIAQKLREKRFNNGAINFSSQEVRFKLDETGKPIGIVVKENKEANKLIEEFMLLANRTVAEVISKIRVKDKPLPFPYRIHDTPDEEKLVPFTVLARKFGYSFNLNDPDSVAASFNAMLSAAKGTPQQHLLEQLGIRTMAKAIYTAENIGHYGLGFENYCHFTSPIRRYPDVMVHRILQQVLDGHHEVDKKMDSKCKHCSERERAAMECERAGNKYKQVEFMSQFIGDEFDAVVTGVSGFGFWAETSEHKCEGLISLKDLNAYDEFRLVDSEYTLVGMGSGRKFRIGDMVRIRVVSANLERRQLDYEWLPTAGVNGEATIVRSSVDFNSKNKKKKDRDRQKEDKKRKRKKIEDTSWLDEMTATPAADSHHFTITGKNSQLPSTDAIAEVNKVEVESAPGEAVGKKGASKNKKVKAGKSRTAPIVIETVGEIQNVDTEESVIKPASKKVKASKPKKEALKTIEPKTIQDSASTKKSTRAKTKSEPTQAKDAKKQKAPKAPKAAKPIPDTAPIPKSIRKKMK